MPTPTCVAAPAATTLTAILRLLVIASAAGLPCPVDPLLIRPAPDLR